MASRAQKSPATPRGHVLACVGALVLTLAGGARPAGAALQMFSDPPRTQARSDFVIGETMYSKGTGSYTPGQQYQIAYYDGNRDLKEVDVVIADGTGTIASDWRAAGAAGQGRVATYDMSAPPPPRFNPAGAIDKINITLLDGAATTYEDADRKTARTWFPIGQPVYALLSGYASSATYQVAYYDALGNLAEVDVVVAMASGRNEDSDWTSTGPVGAGHLVTYGQFDTVPATYSTGDPAILDDMEFAIVIPTCVVLAELSAERHDGTLMVRWRTATEVGIAGYNVVQIAGKKTRRLNRNLIPAARMGLDGARYAFTWQSRNRGAQICVEAVGIDGTFRGRWRCSAAKLVAIRSSAEAPGG